MKTININYRLVDERLRGKIVIISDLHDYPGKRKSPLATDIKKTDPGLILVVGDNINGAKYTNKECLGDLQYFLEDLSEACPVVITRGNHDLVGANERSLKKFKSLERERIIPLENESVEFDHSRVFGVSPSRGAYAPSGQRNGEALMTFLNDWEKNGDKGNLPKNKLNILMCHNPFNVIQAKSLDFHRKLNISEQDRERLAELAKKLSEYKLTASGHGHNGYVLSSSIKKNPVKYMDYGRTEMPVVHDLNGKIVRINPFIFAKDDCNRGLIYTGEGPEKVIELSDENYYYFANENAKPLLISEEDALIVVKALNLTPTVVSGGVNKWFNLPIDKSEITEVNLVKRR